MEGAASRRSSDAFSWASVGPSSLLLQVKPPTGEPDAGDPPVRFGGRGIRIQSVPPTPIFMDPLRGSSSDLEFRFAVFRHGQNQIRYRRLAGRYRRGLYLRERTA